MIPEEKQNKPPKKIYLQWFKGDPDASPDSYDAITWCVDKINDDDIEYAMPEESGCICGKEGKHILVDANCPIHIMPEESEHPDRCFCNECSVTMIEGEKAMPEESYPTKWAYEQLVKHHKEHHDKLDELQRRVAERDANQIAKRLYNQWADETMHEQTMPQHGFVHWLDREE